MVSEIQSVLFDRSMWTVKEAQAWLMKHHFYPIKEHHITAHEIRFRLQNPKKFVRFRTKKLHNGIDLVIGFIN
jgi:hypothetical protein